MLLELDRTDDASAARDRYLGPIDVDNENEVDERLRELYREFRELQRET